MSRTRRFIGGVGTSYAHQITVTLVGLWLTPFLLVQLGAHEYGLWLVAAQFVTYLALLDLGVLALLPRETAYATGRAGGVHVARELPDLVGRTAWLVICQMPLIVAAAALCWWFVPVEWGAIRTPLAIILGAFVLTYPLRICQGILQGCQDLAFVGGMQLAAWMIGVVATVVLVVQGWGIVALASGAALTQVVALVGSALRVVLRYRHALPDRLPRFVWQSAWPQVRSGLWISVGQIAQVMIFATDVVLVAWLFGPVAVVLYSCTQKLVAVLTHQPQILTQAAAPALGELRMSASRSKLFEVTSSLSLALMVASGAVLVLVLAANQAFVSWWVGHDQYAGMRLTLIFAAGMLIRHWNTALVYSLVAFGYERRVSLTNAADGVVTLVCALVFAKALGIVGIPLGFACGALCVSVAFNGAALARDTGVSHAQLLATLIPWAVRLAVVAPLALVAGLLVTGGGLVALTLTSAAILALYGALMWPIAMRPPLGGYVRRAIGPLAGAWLPAPATSSETSPV